MVGRYGGEEFLVVLNKCNLASALARAENARNVIGSRPIVVSGDSLTLTMTVGIALSSEFAESDVDEIIYQADKALYAAKAGGRNCVPMSKPNAEKPSALDEPVVKEPEV